jgi:hypothetical protein
MQRSFFKVGLSKDHKAIHRTWLALIIATLIGWWLGNTGQSVEGGIQLATVGVIITALAKVWVIGFQFMGLHGAPRWLRHGFDVWVLVLGGVLISILITGF